MTIVGFALKPHGYSLRGFSYRIRANTVCKREGGGGGETRNKKTQQMTVVWFVKSEV